MPNRVCTPPYFKVSREKELARLKKDIEKPRKEIEFLEASEDEYVLFRPNDSTHHKIENQPHEEKIYEFL